MAFHRKTGSLITLSNDNRTATRRYASTEFNNGIVLSSKPLVDNEVFEVKIEKRLNSWSGSIEVGVTMCNPDTVNLPTSATGLRDRTWIMSGCSVFMDGQSIKEDYGQDLDRLLEGHTLGVMHTSAGLLHFYINGEDQGVAANNVPQGVYAVVDIYGKCVQCSTTTVRMLDVNRGNVLANQLANEAIAEATALCSNVTLAFHEKCGSLVRLTHDNRTAQRLRPTGEFNNGVVMTNRPLKPDELFEIRLDTMIDKWSGSIEVGITTHNPSLLDFPATMTNMRSGTIMMSGSGILTNGKGTQREYGQFNLDELAEGDRIGLIRKSSGSLHFFINGIDQGVAAVSAPEVVWGVVDLYGMAVKVTILEYGQDPYTSDDDSISASAPLLLSTIPATPGGLRSEAELYDAVESDTDSSDHSIDDNSQTEKLAFHPICGSNVVVSNRNRSVRRHNAMDEFNYGVVLSNRPLKPGEMFEIRIDDVVEKWAGSVEIGVTTFDPLTLDFPATMTNCRQGTWMMTGNGIIHNGVTVIEDYEENLDRVKTGDRVGVVRKEDSNLYFTLNGRNLGLAATNVPSNIYGVLDLYGQAAEASLVPAEGRDCVTVETSDIRFNQVYHGANCVISNNGRSASRPHPREEFSESVVISNRPIRQNEIFEVIIDKTVDRWNGSLEIGVTNQPPEEFFPRTLSEIDNSWRQNVWMLAGSAVIEKYSNSRHFELQSYDQNALDCDENFYLQNGSRTRRNYPLDLDTLDKGSKIGLIVTSDGTLHYLCNGVDYGPACQGLPQSLYVIMEIYGTCAAVSITRNSGMIISIDRPIRSSELRRAANKNLSKSTNQSSANNGNNSTNESKKAGLVRFSECCGKNIQLSHNNTTAQRHRSFNHGVVFSSDPIKPGELFEVRVDEMSRQWSGNLIIGFTTIVVSDNEPTAIRQSTVLELQKNKSTWLISGNKVLLNGEVIQENYSNLDTIDSGSRIGIKREIDSTMHLYINSVDQGVAAPGIPKNVFAVLDIYGSVESVSLINHSKNLKKTSTDNSKLPEQNPSREVFDIDTSLYEEYTFSKISGCNIELFNKSMTARRTAGFNKALLISEKPLSINKPITLKIDELNKKWRSSLSVGLIDCKPENTPTSPSLINVKQNIISYCKSSHIFMDTRKINLGIDLDSLQEGDKIKITIDHNCQVHLHINGIERGVLCSNVSDPVYCVVDLYGRCVQISVCKEDGECRESSDDKEKADDDTTVKEKISHPIPLYCEYQQACERFKLCLSLPDEFFKSKFNKCYCESCHRIRGGSVLKLNGNPQREYSMPVGWCRFAVRVKPRAKALRIFETWNIAYCGIKLESVRKVLDSADLLALADSASGSRCTILGTVEQRHDEKPETFESIPVILSPSIKYAGIHYFTQPIEYRDAKTQKLYKVKLAFQTCIKPNSYNIGPPTLDSPTDTGLKSPDVEWATKERGSVEIYGLLIRLEP